MGALHRELLLKAATAPQKPRSAPPPVRPQVLETIVRVLDKADRPMRACEIHAAAEDLAGERLLWTSVKAALAAGAVGLSPRFQRVRYGVYRSAT